MLPIGILLVIVLGAIAFWPRTKSGAPITNSSTPRESLASQLLPAGLPTSILSAVPTPSRGSLREQQINEEAEAIAEEYREQQDIVWRTALRQKTIDLFAEK